RLPGGRTATASSAAPLLDARIAPLVQSLLGLDTLSAPHPLSVRSTTRAPQTPRAESASAGPQPCRAAKAAAPRQDAHTMDQIASAYGFSGLYRAGDKGAGQTIALYELEPDDPSDIATFQSCY